MKPDKKRFPEFFYPEKAYNQKNEWIHKTSSKKILRKFIEYPLNEMKQFLNNNNNLFS